MSEEAICKICFEGGDGLISVCPCKGSVRWTHDECLRRWYLLGNHECCTCRALIAVIPGTESEFVPWRYDLMFEHSLLRAAAEVLCNLYFYLLLMAALAPHVVGDEYFYGHAAWQSIYYCGYLAFFYFRYIRLVKKKELYISMIWIDVQGLVLIQLVCVLILWFIHQPITHVSAVLLSRYIHNGLLHTHYTTLLEMNQLVPFAFLETVGT